MRGAMRLCTEEKTLQDDKLLRARGFVKLTSRPQSTHSHAQYQQGILLLLIQLFWASENCDSKPSFINHEVIALNPLGVETIF